MNFRVATRTALSRDRRLLVGVLTASSGPLIRIEAARFGKTQHADILPNHAAAARPFAVVNEPDVRRL